LTFRVQVCIKRLGKKKSVKLVKGFKSADRNGGSTVRRLGFPSEWVFGYQRHDILRHTSHTQLHEADILFDWSEFPL